MIVSVDQFLKWQYETCVNKRMLSREYVAEESDTLGYIEGVLALPILSICDRIRSSPDLGIVTEDIFQFSSVSDVTDGICEALMIAKDPVVDAVQLGRILLGAVPLRNIVAYRKYGENHGKMAARLGLVQRVERHYLLSCVGRVFLKLDMICRNRLLVRLLLRTPFVEHLIRKASEPVDMRHLMGELSDSTYLRRRSSIRNMLRILKLSDEIDFSLFLSRLRFE